MGVSSCCQSNETVSKQQEVDMDSLNRPQYMSQSNSPKAQYASLGKPSSDQAKKEVTPKEEVQPREEVQPKEEVQAKEEV